ncbi:MAG: hypothetical protein M1820_005455 [Bogoriella megaspora]|nr:MAG: hypothetical protein M1820_005455 [Bogoriella megaspora]
MSQTLTRSSIEPLSSPLSTVLPPSSPIYEVQPKERSIQRKVLERHASLPNNALSSYRRQSKRITSITSASERLSNSNEELLSFHPAPLETPLWDRASCLQCIVKSLPCDKEHPSCSRCIRNNEGKLCLAQRYMNPDGASHVTRKSGGEGNTVIIYFAEGENNLRQRREEMREKLIDELRIKAEMKNWALPLWNGIGVLR